MRDFLAAIQNDPRAVDVDRASRRREGMSVYGEAGSATSEHGDQTRSHHRRPARSRRQPARRRHGAVGVPHRRPRRALAALGYTVVDKGDLPRRFPKRRSRATSARSTSATSRASASGCIRRRSQSLDEGAMPLVLGGDHSLAAGSVAAAAEWARQTQRAADRPALGRRARRHEHAGDVAVSGNVHGMPLAALLGPEPAELVAHRRLLAEGAAGAHGAHRRPQSRRAREGARSATRACTSSR